MRIRPLAALSSLLTVVALIGAFSLGEIKQAVSQSVCPSGFVCNLIMWINGSGQTVPTSAANPLPVGGTVSVGGFTPSSNYAGPITAPSGSSSAATALPSGSPTSIIVYNNGSYPVSVKLGGNAVAATASNDIVPAGGAFALAVGTNTYIAAYGVGGASSIVVSGGSGLGQSYGGNVTLGQATKAASIPTVGPSDPDYRPAAASTTVVDTGSVTTAGYNSVNYITGTPTAGSVVSFAINGQSNVTVTVSAITGTLSFEISNDGGVTWVNTTMRQRGSGYTTGTTTGIGVFGSDVAGKTNFRVRQTAAGAATVTVTFSSTNNDVQVLNPLRLFDNTSNQQMAIKPASTAPAATDTAIVTTISPNTGEVGTQIGRAHV